MSEAIAVDPQWSGPTGAGTVASRALQREEVPADIVGTLLYLASDDSSFVTGQTIHEASFSSVPRHPERMVRASRRRA